ncbi:glycosyltransferase [Agrobacterium cavarae]|uniref:glycosyltransferase n=1 Tax=Agrobacterium cavarae TaxID=2528239 RepID=UPI003EE6D4A1
MKIALIAPGLISVPPQGWGAVETLVYDYSLELQRQGCDVLIVNQQSADEVIEKVNSYNPHFVHCHADNHIGIMTRINCKNRAFTSHFGYLETPHLFPKYIASTHSFAVSQEDLYLFCLSPSIAQMYLRDGVDPRRIRITPNGVNTGLFKYDPAPTKPHKSVCLAQVSVRKRQSLAQRARADIDFVGGIGSYSKAYRAGFNPTTESYLGEWTREDVYNELTHYGNLVLLSEAEAHPLVCLEALSSGLGVVVSEASSANLDTARSFITVVPEEKIKDLKYLREKIVENRVQAVKSREEIIAYAKSFDYKNIVDRYRQIVDDIVSDTSKIQPVFSIEKSHFVPLASNSPQRKTRFRRAQGLTRRVVVFYWIVKSKLLGRGGKKSP